MPLPSSTALTILTGCEGLTVEQALIAASWPVATGWVSALARGENKGGRSHTAKAAPVTWRSVSSVVSYEHVPWRNCRRRDLRWRGLASAFVSPLTLRQRADKAARPRLRRNRADMAPQSTVNFASNNKKRFLPLVRGPRTHTRTLAWSFSLPASSRRGLPIPAPIPGVGGPGQRRYAAGNLFCEGRKRDAGCVYCVGVSHSYFVSPSVGVFAGDSALRARPGRRRLGSA